MVGRGGEAQGVAGQKNCPKTFCSKKICPNVFVRKLFVRKLFVRKLFVRNGDSKNGHLIVFHVLDATHPEHPAVVKGVVHLGPML
jgi:hypothetical protein